MRLLPGAGRGAAARVRGRRPGAPRGERRRGHVRRHSQCPVHERLLLPLRFCALRRGSWGRTACPRTWSRTTRSAGACARPGSAAPSRGLQGGIHPASTGDYYLWVVRAVKEAAPEIHVHAFSALEVWQGAATLGLPLEAYLARLRDEGLGSLPGTAAEILDDEVRRVICPDKVTTDQWLEVHAAAHAVGLRSNVTMMFGHVEGPRSWALHLLRAREQQQRSGGFTEFVPLPFVHMEAPIAVKGQARHGRRSVRCCRPRRRSARAPSVVRERPGLVGEARAGRRARGTSRRRQRPRRDADERVDLPRGRCPARAGDAAGADGEPDPLGREGSAAADDALRHAARVACAGVFRRRPLAEPVNPPVRDAGLKAPPRLVRPGFRTAAR